MFSLPYCVHIGYPRTGSTWLQKLFGEHPEVCFAYRTQFFGCADNWKRGVKFYESLFKLNKAHKVILDSDERYSIGSRLGFTGWSPEKLQKARYEDSIKYRLPSDSKFIAHQIYRTNSRAKIIMVLRRQPDWLLSNYRNIITGRGKNITFDEFLNSEYVYRVKVAFYSKAAKLYFDLFGRENVLVLFFEEMRENQQEFLNKISSFLNISKFNVDKHKLVKSIRPTPTNRATKLMRKLNYITQRLPSRRNSLYYKFIDRAMLYLDRGFLKKIKDCQLISPEKEKELFNLYKEDNEKLAKLLNKDLGKLGYF